MLFSPCCKMWILAFLLILTSSGSIASPKGEPINSTIKNPDKAKDVYLFEERPTTPHFEHILGEVEIKYVCQPAPEPCPLLKHYEMYPRTPEDNFYPAWTYFGFKPPVEWRNVDIDLFEAPHPKIVDPTNNEYVRRQGSAMHLCTSDVTPQPALCRKRLTNECDNEQPSPINIISKFAKLDNSLHPFEFINYDTSFGFEMFFETDGTQLLFVKPLPHSQQRQRPSMIKGPLEPGVELHLDRIIVRVGTDHKKGSEHAIDSKFFGMELQFFFTKDDLPYWQTLSRYKVHPERNGTIESQLHVVSIFLNVIDEERGEVIPEGAEYVGDLMDTLSLAAERFWRSGNTGWFSKVKVDQKIFSLDELFETPMSGRYYTYNGSLSHPPCLTPVPWTVFEKPAHITYNQWRRFTLAHVEYSDLQTLGGNVRPLDSIKVKVNLTTLGRMNAAQGLVPINQEDLDEATFMARVPSIELTNGVITQFAQGLTLIRPYNQFPIYFARKVRKSDLPRSGAPGSEFDIYDTDKSGNPRRISLSSSFVTKPYFSRLHAIIIVFALKLF